MFPKTGAIPRNVLGMRMFRNVKNPAKSKLAEGFNVPVPKAFLNFLGMI